MIGEITNEHIRQDIIDVKNLGLDGFALNFGIFPAYQPVFHLCQHFQTNSQTGPPPRSPSSSTTQTPSEISTSSSPLTMAPAFSQATPCNTPTTSKNTLPGLPTSTSSTHPTTTNPSPSSPPLAPKTSQTTNGTEFKRKVGDVLIVPGFYKIYNPPTSFFEKYSTLDGIFSWNSWPQACDERVAVSASDDRTFLNAAYDTGKIFMMGISPVQYKHLDDVNNWYRRGEENLENRFSQILDLQSWNDAGEV
jgi:hypothetical protein